MRHAIPTSLKSESHEPRKATVAVQTLCVSNELAAIWVHGLQHLNIS
jgi:hypothetical protein